MTTRAIAVSHRHRDEPASKPGARNEHHRENGACGVQIGVRAYAHDAQQARDRWQHLVGLNRRPDHAIDADGRQARVTDDDHADDSRRKRRIIAHESLRDDRERQTLGGHDRERKRRGEHATVEIRAGQKNPKVLEGRQRPATDEAAMPVERQPPTQSPRQPAAAPVPQVEAEPAGATLEARRQSAPPRTSCSNACVAPYGEDKTTAQPPTTGPRPAITSSPADGRYERQHQRRRRAQLQNARDGRSCQATKMRRTPPQDQ